MVADAEVAIRAALGINGDGTCCRHPNQMIYAGDTNQQNGSPRQRKLPDIVHTCRICESESLAGGVRQRKSFAVIISQVQTLHANKKEWNEFKKNWTPIGEEGGEQKMDGSPRSPSIIGRVLSAAAGGNNSSNASNSINVDDLTRQLTLRLAQVQDWILKEKEKELEAAAKMGTSMSGDSSSQQVNELKKQIQSMQLVIDGQNEQIAKLQKKAEKQQKTITQELKMIKMIALKRANQTNAAAAPIPEIDALRNPEESPGSNSSDRRKGTGAITNETSEDGGRRRTDGSSELSATALELLPQEPPPRQPERKRSGTKSFADFQPRLPAEMTGNVNGDRRLAQDGLELDGTSASRESAPQMPVRQMSKSTSPKISQNTGEYQPNKVIARKVSLNNRENSAKPTVPRRVDLPEITVSTRADPLGMDSHDAISAITSSVISEAASSYAPSSVPTYMSTNTTGTKQQKQPRRQVYSRRSEDLASLDEALDSEDADGEPDAVLPPAQKAQGLSHEISFVPTESDDSVPPPPPPPPPEFDLIPSKLPSFRLGSGPVRQASSQEISFDASREFRISSPDLRRQSNVQDIEFDQSQPLLFEASQALAISQTPMSIQHKSFKKSSNNFINRGSQSMSDLNFDVKDFEFDAKDSLMMEAKQAFSTPLAVQRKSLIKMHSASNRGKAAHKEIKFGLDPVLSQTSADIKASVAKEFAANPDSIFNTQPQRKKLSPVEYGPDKLGGAQQEFTIGQEDAAPNDQDEAHDDDFDDEDDFFLPPPDLPIDDAGYLECLRNHSLSPVSDLSEGSYLLDLQLREEAEFAEIAEEDGVEPRKGLGGGVTKQLPLEADLEFSDDEDDTVESHQKKAKNEENDDDDSDNTGDIPARHQSILKAPRPLSATPSILRAAANKGAAAGSDDIVSRTLSKMTYHVHEENVQDKYGDGGEYTGSVSVQDNLPHGHGLMKYDNDRQYEGDWSDGRW